MKILALLIAHSIAGAAWLMPVLSLFTADARAADLEAGKRLFNESCAVCHGTSGEPDPDSAVVKGLGVVPADFSDALFNSREPAGDWEMVVAHGGAAMGLAEQMPAFGEVMSATEVRNVVAYVKTLAETRDFPPGEMNLMLPIRTKKAFPEDEVVYQGRFTPQDGEDAWKNVVEFEKRVGKRGQAIVELIHEAQDGSGELAEIEAGYKQAILFDATSILSAAALVAIPIEAEGDGEFQTYLAYGRRLSPDWTFQGSARLKFPFDKASDGEVELAGVVHYVHTPWPRSLFPALEVTMTAPYESVNGDVEWTAMPQLRHGLTRGGHVAVNVGVELPLSGQSWDYRLYLTLLWDFADGSLLKGW